MGPTGNNGRSQSDLANQHADNDQVVDAEQTTTLNGQAQAAIELSQPAAGETVVVNTQTGATYVLAFDPTAAGVTLEGPNLVLTFDANDDGAANSRIVFLDLAELAETADAPVFQVAGVNYEISALLDSAQVIAKADGESAEDPALETARGFGEGSQPQGGGATQYQDNTESSGFSEGIGALSGVGGSLGGDVGPEVSSGTVISGLPVVVASRTEIVSTPDSGGDTGGDGIEIISGEVVDGYIANATVFRDANENGALDDGEVSTITDINGNFTLEGGNGPLVAVGGTDVSTGLAFEGVLKAPAGATVITPLTTLVQQLVEAGSTADAAATSVKNALGINQTFDLSNTDPIAAAAGGNSEALNVVKAGIQVANTASQVKSALKGAGATSNKAASDAAFKAIATKIASEGGNTDLKDTTQVNDVLNNAAANGGVTFDGNDVANATNVITATNTVVEAIDPGTGTSTEVLTKLAQVAQVAQDQAADAIEDAVGNNNDAADDAFDSDSEIQTGADNAEVGDVDGSDALTQGADNFTGDAAGNSIDGLGGNDTLRGEGGADAISGGAGNDLIYGGTGKDVLSGGSGNDQINGGAGNDDIVGNAGSDTIDGGDGTDVARFEAGVKSFSFALGGSGEILVTRTSNGDVDSLTNIESISFANSDVLLVGAGRPFTTIQAAINAAEAGDTILVTDGSYGPITIDKSLTLLALGDAVTITGAGVNQGSAVRIENGVDDVTLGGPANGFNIETGDGDLAAVYVVGANEGVVIEGNTILGGTGHALLTGGQIDGLTLRGNDLSGEGPAAVAYNNGEASLGAANASSDVRLIDNTITGGDDAGLLLGVEADDAVITGNTFTGTAGFGLLEIFGEDAVITGNTFDGQGFVPAIRDSFDNYDDDALVAGNSFSGGAITVLSPSASVIIDADQLSGVTTLDVSSLSAAAVTFTSLGELTQIITSSGQNVELDGSEIDAISGAEGTLTIVGGAAVNIVNAGLTLPNDGQAPSVSNLLALEFEGLDGQQSLIPANLTLNGSHASAFAAFWIPLDQNYVGAQDFFNLDINTSFAYLGNDYVRYLNAGGEALLDLVKVPTGRLQTLHDNLLGNLNDSPIASRFTNGGGEDPRTPAAEAFGDRPIHDGAVDGLGLYTDFTTASGTIGWDLAHGVDYPNGLPSPYDGLDEANTLAGTAAEDFFYGGGGDDTITGGDDSDTASYFGDRSDFEIVATADGGFTLTDTNTADGDEGNDTLNGIENLQFGDGTLHFGATLARTVPEVGDGNDGFHPGSGNSDVNFVIHDNTETRIEAAIKAKVRFQGDPDSEGLTYDVETGHTAGSTTGAWNFDYSIVDYGAADISAANYTIAIVADFTDIHGNVTEGFMTFDPIAHREATSEDYYQDASGGTDGLQNSQNIGWYAPDYDATTPGSYDFVLTVRDADSGEILAETQMRVEVAPNIVVGAGGDYATIQEAVTNASEGDTILVLAGDYTETVTIGKQITLLGAGGDNEAVLTGAIILQDGADGTRIEGFTIAEGANIGGETAGIYLANGATDVTVQNNAFERSGIADGDGVRGILTTSGGGNSGLLVSQNSFTGWATGVFLNPDATDAEIIGNVFDGNYVGMSIDGPDGTLVTGNTFSNNGYEGLGIGPGEANPALTLNGNTFADNGAETDGRSIGVYENGVTVTSDDAGTNTVLELQAGVTEITLAGSGNLSVIGNDAANDIEANAGANLLEGGGGADLLYGGAGDDTLFGDAGADTLFGGAGGDTFAFDVLLDAGDLIDGFSSADGDRIDLDALFDSLGVAEDAIERAARVNVEQAGSNADATIAIDSNGDTVFDTVIVSVTTVTGDLNADSLILSTV